MQLIPRHHLLAASTLALALAFGPAFAQQAQPDAAAPETPPAMAQGDVPLAAPDTPAKRAQALPESFADLVERVSPAVVNITTTSIVSAPVGGGGPMLPPGSPFSDLFRDFGFPGMPGDRGQQGPSPFGQPGGQRSNALGSGFVVSADGFIVTNNHVIDGADEIEIEFKDGQKRAAEVIGTDDKTDIALLKVDATDLPFVEFGDSDRARVGDWVLALGNPLGQGLSATTGIVSARGRELTGTYDDFIQTDASINRGNSGGPLFNMDGEVVGVNTAILSPNGGSIGIGFSMASNVVSQVVSQLQQFGETRRGWLGVKIQDLTPDMADAMGIAAEGGAMVTDVPEGPAAEAGMQAGDVITAFAGKPVSDTRDLVRRVAEAPIGEAVSVQVMRGGEARELQITLGRRELAEGGSNATVQSAGPQSDRTLGMSLAPLTPEVAAELGIARESKGLVVQGVDPDGAAAEKGLAAGDVIAEVGQQPVATVADLEAQVAAARDAGRKSILLLIRRAGEPRFVALPVDES